MQDRGTLNPHDADLVAQAVSETDRIVATFASLSLIAQSEGGSPKSRFGRVDLAALAETFVEVYGPSAEDTGHQIEWTGVGGGRKRIAGAGLANLIENALRHTPPGSQISVGLSLFDGRARLGVADNGCGLITRRELTATELRAAAGKTKDARAARRMLAIALVQEGVDRTTAAQTCGMDRQTLRGEEDQETVRGTVSPTNGHRYNAEGLAGLVNRRVAHRPWRLAPEQLAALAAWVEAGPDPVRDGVVRWRRKDLQARIEAAFGVVLHERSVGKQLAALGFRRLSVRPQHPKPDPEAQAAFKKTSPKR